MLRQGLLVVIGEEADYFDMLQPGGHASGHVINPVARDVEIFEILTPSKGPGKLPDAVTSQVEVAELLQASNGIRDLVICEAVYGQHCESCGEVWTWESEAQAGQGRCFKSYFGYLGNAGIYQMHTDAGPHKSNLMAVSGEPFQSL